MAVMAYDELNNREYARPTNKAIPYEQYFGEMDLDEEEIEERIAMAEDLEDVFKFLFAIIAASKALEAELQQTELAESTAIRYRDVVEDFGYDINEDYPYLDGYIGTVTDDIVENTLEHLTDGYYTSDDRAMFIAENETNAVKNYVGLIDAIKAGFTTKRWVTMGDQKVRHTHRLVDGEEVGILDDFEVGNAKMLFPKDASRGAGAEEIVNCRCVVTYGGLSGILSGAVKGAWNDENDPYNEKRTKIAEEQYEQIRNRKREYEISAVAKNSGMSQDDIERVFAHVFEREHLFEDGSVHRFDPDYYMYHSWQRLREGKTVYPHDLIMLQHELAEEKIMGNSLEIVYEDAHNEVVKKYDYEKALLKYLKEHDA